MLDHPVVVGQIRYLNTSKKIWSTKPHFSLFWLLWGFVLRFLYKDKVFQSLVFMLFVSLYSDTKTYFYTNLKIYHGLVHTEPIAIILETVGTTSRLI